MSWLARHLARLRPEDLVEIRSFHVQYNHQSAGESGVVNKPLEQLVPVPVLGQYWLVSRKLGQLLSITNHTPSTSLGVGSDPGRVTDQTSHLCDGAAHVRDTPYTTKGLKILDIDRSSKVVVVPVL